MSNKIAPISLDFSRTASVGKQRRQCCRPARTMRCEMSPKAANGAVLTIASVTANQGQIELPPESEKEDARAAGTFPSKPRSAAPRAHASNSMFLQVGSNAYEITSFEQASRMFCAARDKYGEGAARTPTPVIRDHAGSAIAHVSYNGRVWPGSVWTPDATPLYDNRTA